MNFKTLKIKKALTILFVLVGVQFISSQIFYPVTGPSPVDGYSTHTYQFSNGFVHTNRQWVIVGGTKISEWYTKFPDTYYVSVTWANGTSGSVSFKSNGNTLGVKNVTINPITSIPTVLSDENYIYNITPRVASTSTSTLAGDEMIESVTYFDGLGRPMQSNAIRGGGDNEDIITHIAYDGFGRQAKEYLPYTLSLNGGAFKTDALSATNTFYDATKYDDDFPWMNTSTINPYSEKAFDLSPLNRVTQQGAPGKDWKIGEGHEIEFEYETNDTLSVRYYKVTLSFANNTYTPTLVANGDYYNPGELLKTVTYDENHTSGTGHSTEEYKNKQGQVILKRTYNSGEAHDTYYVYDDYGNLTYVISPNVSLYYINWAELNELSYQYKYDQRNRLVEKKIPGKGWEYIIYNKTDQPILTQDANQRVPNPDEWLFTKYDPLGRIAYTGLMTSNSSRTSLQASINALSTQHDTKSSSYFTKDGLSVYYNNNAYPTSLSSITELHTVNYYDGYSGIGTLPGGLGTSVTTYYGLTSNTKVKGQITMNKTRVLEVTSNKWITSVTYYDDKYRPIYVYVDNPYLGTIDIVETKYDFAGTVIETKSRHTKSGSTITTIDMFEYDHMNRLIEHSQIINGGSEEIIAQNTYDELGQLVQKSVGGTTAQSRLQVVDYTYNVRGWLKQINNPNASLGNDLFAFKINYNTASHSGTKLYNGNIAETEWKTANDNALRWYRYNYDDLNRITSGTANSSNYNLTSVGYDKNGNITSLQRRGHTNSGATTFGVMDNLVYTYQLQTNKLLKVLDNGNDTYGFSDGVNQTEEYTYDANGNMITDDNKFITNINYNHLNLPTSISINGGGNVGTISYIYDATGVKLKKSVSTGATTYYAGNYVYEGSSLKFFNHPEGYVEPDGSGWDYVYQYKDHLGNIRVSYKDDNHNGAVTSSEILEENNYYPFGLKHKGYNNVINGTDHPYGFGGKEEQSELGLGWIDITARNYDPALGRWMNLDPLAEEMRRHSPYNYAFDNPIRFIDSDGMEPIYDEDGNLIGYRVEEGQGPSQIAEDLNNLGILSSNVSYLDIVNSNPDFFTNVENIEDINDSGFSELNMNEGDMLKLDVVLDNENAIAQEQERVDGLSNEIEANEATIAENNKDTDSIDNAKTKAVEEMQFKIDLGLYEPEPGDPKIGLAIARARDLAKTDRLVKKADSQIQKLQNTNDSLKHENNKKKAAIIKSGHVPSPNKKIKD